MSKQQQAAKLAWFKTGQKMRPDSSSESRSPTAKCGTHARIFRALLGAGIVLLGSCSDEKPPRQESELQTRNTTRSQVPDAAPAATTTTSSLANQPAANSARYSVTAETAYFFDAPQQTKLTGKYLLRGDVIYGEGESNGFVKTRFKNPNGATVTGWLKANELRQLTSRAVAQNTRLAQQPPVSADEYNYEVDEPAAATSTGTQTAVVQVARSYFYSSPDLTQPRKAHCVQGDKVRLGEAQGEAVYVSFTNWQKVTTTGWMRKDALGYGQ